MTTTRLGFLKKLRLAALRQPNRVVSIQYENMDALKKWWDGGGRDIQEKVGTKYATFRVVAIDGVEMK